MTTHKEALTLALDWFVCYQDKSMSRNNAQALAEEVVEAIKEALAQPVSSHGNAEDLYVEMNKHLNCPHCGGSGHIDDVAQPEQEPVAWFWKQIYTDGYEWKHMADNQADADKFLPHQVIPLYTTPPQRKPLTDEMVVAAARLLNQRHADACGVDGDDLWALHSEDFKEDASALLKAAHGIKGEA